MWSHFDPHDKQHCHLGQNCSTWKCLLHRQYLRHLRQLWCMVYQSTLEDSATGPHIVDFGKTTVHKVGSNWNEYIENFKATSKQRTTCWQKFDWPPVLNANKNNRKRRLGWIKQQQSSISCTTLIDHLPPWWAPPHYLMLWLLTKYTHKHLKHYARFTKPT